MKKRRVLSIISACMLIFSILSFGVSASVQWTYISVVSNGLSFDSYTATADAMTSAYEGLGVTSSKVVCYLQRNSGSGFTTIASWTNTSPGTFAECGGTYYVGTGNYTYRVYSIHYVYNSNNTLLESTVAISGTYTP